MLSASIVVLFTSLIAGFAAAQNSTSDFNPGLVDLPTKNSWCAGEQNNCPILCGGLGFTMKNDCNGATLTYTCTCSNGTGPASIAQYQGTLPNFICQATFGQCRQNTPGSTSCQTCGTLQASSVPASTSSASAASSTSASATGSATAASASASKSSAADAALHGSVSSVGTGLLGGFLAMIFL